ncbi:DUF2236 domain-containing protein [Streptomyces sp. GS7]|uniref:DUF2236 domain-containing protein n=1 Tax=Streptomyces sp. GS7 TaxID=2692234 RepID=UPI00131723DC|nr:DUF2236 domain-containing protein [Streptomyces sp. GS7]QHC24453.1 hypothetical protein GR130_26855 [Streptomyces sp. GS7]
MPPPVLCERLGLRWTDRQQRRLRRFARVVHCLAALVPPPRIAPAMFLAYRNTRRPGTDPHTRRPLGATV